MDLSLEIHSLYRQLSSPQKLSDVTWSVSVEGESEKVGAGARTWQCHRHGEVGLGLAVASAYLYLTHAVFITMVSVCFEFGPSVSP